MKINLKSQDVAVIAICAALYAVVGRLTAGVTFLGVGLLPAVVIPAVFAVLYRPWVGGIGGAIGIFIRDMFVHGNALLSLAAGVPPNFILFFLIGYIAARNIDTKKIVVSLAVSVAIVVAGLIVPAIIYPTELSIAAGGLSIAEILLVFGLTVVLSIVVISAVAIRWFCLPVISTEIGIAAFTLHKEHPLTMEVPHSQYPIAAIDFLREHRFHGRTLAFFDWGEMQIFRLRAARHPWTAGFDTCYSRELIAAHWKFYNNEPFDKKVLDGDQADLALLPANLAGTAALAHGRLDGDLLR